jgi:hypothetical protein
MPHEVVPFAPLMRYIQTNIAWHTDRPRTLQAEPNTTVIRRSSDLMATLSNPTG